MSQRVDPDLAGVLPYAASRKKRRGWLLPAGIAVGVIIAWFALLAAGKPALQRAMRQFQTVSLWERCNVTIAPAQDVVWEEDPDAVEVLLADASHYDPSPYSNIQPGAMRKTSADRLRLMRMLGFRDPPSGPTLFMHDRTSPGGEALADQRQLLIIDLISTRGGRRAPNTWAFELFCIFPGPLGDLRVRQSNASIDLPAGFLTAHRYVRFYAGQPDPYDNSHFEIPYAVDSEQGTIEGWLTDVNRPTLRVRDGPALVDMPPQQSP